MIHLITLLCLLLCVSPAGADTLTLISGSANDGQYYVGPLTADLNGSPIPGGVTCLDTGHESYLGTTWPVAVHTLDPQNMTGAMFGSDPPAILKYEEAAWLLSQFQGNPGQVVQIQHAVWDLFHPGYSGDVGTWLTAAEAINPANYSYASVVIYTPVGAGVGNQEFMSGGTSKVPLPPTVVLLGTGLIGIWGIRKWK